MRVISKVISNEKIAEKIFSMEIFWENAENICFPGQFINIDCKADGSVLRRPISICDVYGDVLRIVYEVKGKGTLALSGFKSGDEIDFLAPLGRGFDLGEFKNPVIIGGGIGAYPLLNLAKHFENPRVFLGFRNKDAVTLENEFAENSDLHISTDDGSYGYHGFVTQLAEENIAKNGCDVIYACGPLPMLKNTVKLAEKLGVECFISMEERMGCGIGACLVCACKVKRADGEGYAHVCKDGPVFNSKEVIFE